MATGSGPETIGPRHVYEIRVVGSLGPAATQAFSDLAVDSEPNTTILCGSLDQQGLHALLDRVRGLALELVGVELIDSAGFEPPATGLRP